MILLNYYYIIIIYYYIDCYYIMLHIITFQVFPVVITSLLHIMPIASLLLLSYQFIIT